MSVMNLHHTDAPPGAVFRRCSVIAIAPRSGRGLQRLPFRQAAQGNRFDYRPRNTGAGNNCASCHNGSRAFSGNIDEHEDVNNCHTGSGFDMLPGGPF